MSYREQAFEVICVLSWSWKAQRAFTEALDDYRKAGCPPIPLGASNYRRTFMAKRKAKKRAKK